MVASSPRPTSSQFSSQPLPVHYPSPCPLFPIFPLPSPIVYLPFSLLFPLSHSPVLLLRPKAEKQYNSSRTRRRRKVSESILACSTSLTFFSLAFILL